MNVRKNILLRVYIAFFLVALLGAGILWRITQIQLVEGSYWRERAEELTTAFVNIEPVRGNIYSEDGSLMVTSLPIYEIRMDLNANALTDDIFYSRVDSLSLRLSQFFKDRSKNEWRNLLVTNRKRGHHYFLIKRRVTHQQLKEVEQFPLFRLGQYKGGFIVEERSQRIKPFRNLAQRTLGYKVPEVTPVGLEGAYDEFLSGTIGKRLMQKVAGGIWIPINDRNEIEPQNGQDIHTTIDINLQDVAENALLRQLQRYNALHGCAVVMEVETGAIKAIANLQKDKEGDYWEQYNFAVGASTEPGSTFKLAGMMGLLEHGFVRPEDTIHTGDGEFRFYDRIMRDATDEGGYGVLTMHEAFAKSSNVGISRAMVKHYGNQPKKFIDFLYEIGLHRPLGLRIAGEGLPVIKQPSDEDWSGITLPWMSIGYEVRLTPLQILALYNAVANDGKMMKPYFVEQVTQVGKLVEQFRPEVLNEKICSDETLEALHAMLEEVVETGTASNLRDSEYRIAGKTGTAQIASEGSYTRQKEYQASFAGYFPAEDPKYSCIVVVNGPEGVYYGAWVAGPVFKEISDKLYAHHLNLQEGEEQQEQEEEPVKLVRHGPTEEVAALCEAFGIEAPQEMEAEWVRPQLTDSTVEWTAHTPSYSTVADVRGLPLSDALYLLENQGLEVGIRGTGKVVSQSILPGTEILGPRKIELVLN